MGPGSVFHYTSAQGLLGIIEEGVLWASEASSLNDTEELNQGWSIIENWLSKQEDSEAISALRDLARVPRSERSEVLVLSASTDPDDVGQWRSYGAHGRGYVVELDASAPLAALASGPEPPPEDQGGKPGKRRIQLPSKLWLGDWEQVLYSATEVEQAMDELVESRDHLVAWTYQADDETDFDLRRQEVEADVLGMMSTLAGRYKSPGFMGEREYRVLVSAEWGYRHLHHRAGQYGVVAYAKLTGAPDVKSRFLYGTKAATRSLPIRSVRVGPGLPDENVATVARLLMVNGYVNDVRVAKCRVPLR